MKFLILFAAFLANVAADSTRINGPECGRRLKDLDLGAKILGGRPSKFGDWGWMVSLNTTKPQGYPVYYKSYLECGASLINNEWILTSAKCGGSSQLFRMNFMIGHNNIRNPERYTLERRPRKQIRHEDFENNKFRSNIALYKVDPIKYTKRNKIVPVCIPNGQVEYKEGRQAIATGWGDTSDLYYDLAIYLKEVKMPILGSRTCKKKYPRIYSKEHFCAGVDDDYADTCEGDEGGPLVIQHTDSEPSNDTFDDEENNAQPSGNRWYLAGITSHGGKCGKGRVYTKTSAFYSWIKKTIREN